MALPEEKQDKQNNTNQNNKLLTTTYMQIVQAKHKYRQQQQRLRNAPGGVVALPEGARAGLRARAGPHTIL